MSKINWKIIEDLDELYAIKNDWSLLCQHCDFSLFTSPDWVLSWINTYWQPEWKLQVTVGYQGKQLIALIPFYIKHSNKLFKKNSYFPLGQGEPEKSEVTSEYQDILMVNKSSEFEVEILKKIKTLTNGNIYWHAIREGSHIFRISTLLYPNKLELVGQSYTIDNSLQGSWSAEVNLSKNNRSKWKRIKKKLESQRVKLSWIPFDKRDYYWQNLIELHQLRWQTSGKAGAFSHPDFSRFHAKFSRAENTKISVLEIDKEPVAINYYYFDNKYLYFYQAGWNILKHSNLSPGFALHMWSIENSPKAIYDFMMSGKTDSYKSKFSCNLLCNMYNLSPNNYVSKFKQKLVSLFRKKFAT